MRESVTLIFVGFAILLILLSLPLIFNKVKPNWFYGLRTPTTVNNPDVWYLINRKTATQMLYFAIVLILVALGLDFYTGLESNLLIAINAGLAAVGIGYITISGIFEARRLASK